VLGSQVRRVILLWLTCTLLIGCSTPPPATQTTVRVEVPVEVTRLVSQQLSLLADNLATPVPPCTASHVHDTPVVTIGAILPLSSPGAILAGFAMQTALNIAVTDINNQGGILGVPVRLVTYDSAGIPERGAQFAERLILLDCAVGIVGLYHNSVTMAVSDVAHRYGIPGIVAGANADEITARGYPEIFRLAPADSILAQMPTLWLSELGDHNNDGTVVATIIADNNSKHSYQLEAIHNNLVQAEIFTELLRVDLPSTDFSSVIARLVAQDHLPDAIFIYISGEPALLLQAELLAAGIGPKSSTIIVQHRLDPDSAQFWANLPDGNGTVIAHTGAWPTTLTQQGQGFAIKYDSYTGQWPEAYAFAAYDSVLLLAAAIENAPSLAGTDLITALERTDQELTSGHITFPFTATTLEPASHTTYLWHQWVESPLLYLQYTHPNQKANDMAVIWPPHYRTSGEQTAATPSTP
jgi:branched-chain amino acid transport system substrate-binding protein